MTIPETQTTPRASPAKDAPVADTEVLIREAHRRRRRRRGAIGALLVFVSGAAVAVAMWPPTPRGTTTPNTTTPPTTSVAIGASDPGCNAKALYAAAAAKEHFTSSSPGYRRSQASPPGVPFFQCFGPWALGSVSRPAVGITDGETIFHAVHHRWTEVTLIGFPVCRAWIEHETHMPLSTLHRMIPGPGTCA